MLVQRNDIISQIVNISIFKLITIITIALVKHVHQTFIANIIVHPVAKYISGVYRTIAFKVIVIIVVILINPFINLFSLRN